MPLINDTGLNDFYDVPDLQKEEATTPSFADTSAAAFHQENDIVNVVEMMTAPKFKPVVGFDLMKEAKARNLDPADYTQALSSDQLDFLSQKRKREDHDREILAASGWSGTGMSILAGLISPTTFIPFLGEAGTGMKAIGLGALNVAAGAGAQEAVLLGNQETRTTGEAAVSIGASLILGGILGGVAHTASKSVLDKIAHDMVNTPRVTPISGPIPSVGDAGAKEADHLLEDAGGLVKGFGADKLAYLSPITRNFQQWNAPAFMKDLGGSAQTRKMTAGFSQAGLSLEGNNKWVTAVAGGNVEDLKRTYAAVSYAGSKALENNYVEYILGEKAGGLFKKSRAVIAGARRPDGKLTYAEYKRQVALDIWSNFTNEGVPAAVRKASKDLDENVYKKLYEEGVKAKLFTGKEKTVGDENYANRVYNHEVIMRRHNEFVDILAKNFEKQLGKTYNERLEKLRDGMRRDQNAIDDAQLPLEQAQKLRDDMLKEQVNLEGSTNPEIIKGAKQLKKNAADVKKLKLELDNLNALKFNGADLAGRAQRQTRVAEIEAALKAKALENEGLQKGLGEGLDQYRKAATEIRRRLSNLQKAHSVQDVKMGKKLDKIVANEDAQVKTILRAQQQLQKFVDALKTGSPKKIEAALKKLQDSFAEHAKQYDKYEQKLYQLEDEGTGAATGSKTATGEDPALRITDRMDSLAGRMDKMSAKIEELQQHDPAEWATEIKQMMSDLAQTHAKINEKRVLRNEKLWKSVENLSPEARAKRLEAMKLKATLRRTKFSEGYATKTEGNVLEGNADFSKYARDRAKDVVDKIQGNNRRLAYSDLIKEKRGPELARVLNIPSAQIADFLETDAEKMVAIYTRTLGADLSIAKVFGTPDAAEDFIKLNDERHAMLDHIKTLKDKDGNPLSKEEQEKLQYKTNAFYDDAKKNIEVLIERAKGTRSIPKDPTSWSARGAKTAMELNFMRLIGGAVVNSVADPARLVMKYGLTRTFRDGFFPLVRAFKEIRMSQREALLAGVGLDPVLHSRAFAFGDIFDDAHRGTVIERGLHYASTKMGAIALFDYWTSAMKQLSAGVANAKFMDSIALLMEGGGSAKEIEKAQRFLARNNIDEELAQTIWKEVTNGTGGGKVNGVWLPNTEAWNIADPAVARAQQAYRAALGGEVDSTIITPGFERPNWVDSSIPARLVAQFRSFGLSSTQKTLMAGLQEHDAAFLNGAMVSLALGAVSYYLWAVAAGGKSYDEMNAALHDLDGEGWRKFADEAISRSGLTGVFDEVQRAAQKVPLIKKYASFSGKGSTRRGGSGLLGETLGPSFDLLGKAYDLGTEADQPTKATLHKLRQMLPFQNVFYLRRLLDLVEAAAGQNLPERRGK